MFQMTSFAHGFRGMTRIAVAAAALMAATSAPALAQDDPNPGALTLTAGLDVPSVYFFRGIRQEADPKLTLWPFGDLGIALYEGDGGIKSVGVNLGVWHSLHTGTSGSGGPSERIHYEEDFYTTLALGFGGGVTLGTSYAALTSPNGMFSTVKELQFRVSVAHTLAPYVFLARELGAEPGLHQADGGAEGGTYLELGVGPSWALGGGTATLAVPMKLGMSVGNYYETLDGAGAPVDEKFGFFSIGGLVTFPLAGVPSAYGSWNFHAGADVLTFGETTKAFNAGDKSQAVVLFGFGVSY